VVGGRRVSKAIPLQPVIQPRPPSFFSEAKEAGECNSEAAPLILFYNRDSLHLRLIFLLQ
jgi:hypothetical protein